MNTNIFFIMAQHIKIRWPRKGAATASSVLHLSLPVAIFQLYGLNHLTTYPARPFLVTLTHRRMNRHSMDSEEPFPVFQGYNRLIVSWRTLYRNAPSCAVSIAEKPVQFELFQASQVLSSAWLHWSSESGPNYCRFSRSCDCYP